MTNTKNTPTARFTDFPKDTNWVTGECGGFIFQAKIFDEPSIFGINVGRVSKLDISSHATGIVVNYDRGWDIEPTADIQPVYDAIMALLESSPKRWA